MTSSCYCMLHGASRQGRQGRLYVSTSWWFINDSLHRRQRHRATRRQINLRELIILSSRFSISVRRLDHFWSTAPVNGSGGVSYTVSPVLKLTRKLCYRKDDRAMRPTYGCPENFRDSLTTPTATVPNIFVGFCSDRPYECSYKIWSP